MRMKTTLLIALVALSGCSTVPPAEYAWQAMHVIDVAQTLNGPAKDPCYIEVDPITRGLIGKNPSSEAVVLWGIGTGIAHIGVTHLLEKHDAPKWVRVSWHAVSLVTKGHTLISNHREGIRPFGNNEEVTGCLR